MERGLADRTHRRDHLQEALCEALRRLGPLSRSVSESLALQLGINATDLRCLRLLQRGGPRTAGQVARQLGLTTGAATAVLDRLERAGLVRRTRDSIDRRRVIVHFAPAAQQRLHALDTAYSARIRKAAAGLTARQLTVVLSYMTKVVDIGAAHVDWLRKKASPADSSSATEGRSAGGRTFD